MENLKFIRLANGDDVVANIDEETDTTITISNPLVVEVETFIDEGKQLLFMKEYLPQSIVAQKHITIDKEMLLSPPMPIVESFIEQYTSASDYFYNPKEKKAEKRQTKGEKVVSLLEAMVEKKDKPVH